MADKLDVDNEANEPKNGHRLPVTRELYWASKSDVKNAKAAYDEHVAKVKIAADVAKTYKAKHRQARKRMEAHGFSLAEIDYAEELVDLNDVTLARGRVLRLLTYLDWEGLELPIEAIDVDFDPYDGVPPLEADRLRYRELGYLAASSPKGANPNNPPEGYSRDQAQYWSEGVNAKYAEIADGLAKIGPLFDPANEPEQEDKKAKKAKAKIEKAPISAPESETSEQKAEREKWRQEKAEALQTDARATKRPEPPTKKARQAPKSDLPKGPPKLTALN